MSDSVFTGADFSDFGDYADFSFLSDDPRASKREDSDRKLKILKTIVLCFGILLAVEGILYAVVVPCLAPAKIECTGQKNYSVSELLAAVSEVDNSVWLKFDVGLASDRIAALPGIEAVSVVKSFPDKVLISVTEREAVAKTIVSSNGRSVSVQIDKNGVLFTSNSSNVANDSNIPLITGLPVQLQEGTRLPQKYRSLMERIAEISALPQKYFAAVSEIQVVPKEYGNYELVLYPVHSHTRVVTDSNLNEQALEYMIVTLDVINKIELDVQELDLRYGAVSYKTR